MSTIASNVRLSRDEAEALLFQQADYIDNRDYMAFVDCFTPDASYWIPARPTDTDPETTLSYLYDGVPAMTARSERLLDSGTGGQQPVTRSSHVIGNVRVIGTNEAGEVIVRSRFHVTQFRRDALKFYSGGYTHHFVQTDGGWKIRFQRVDLIDCDGIHDAILQVFL